MGLGTRLHLTSHSVAYLSCVSEVVDSLSRNNLLRSSREKCLSTSSSLSTTQLLRAFLWAWRWKIFSSMEPVCVCVCVYAHREQWMTTTDRQSFYVCATVCLMISFSNQTILLLHVCTPYVCVCVCVCVYVCKCVQMTIQLANKHFPRGQLRLQAPQRL